MMREPQPHWFQKNFDRHEIEHGGIAAWFNQLAANHDTQFFYDEHFIQLDADHWTVLVCCDVKVNSDGPQ